MLWSYSSPELYELLVLRRGWPPDRYGRFVADGMIAALLPNANVDLPGPAASGAGTSGANARLGL